MNSKWRKQADAIGWGTHAVVHLAVPIDGRKSSIIAVKSKNIYYAYDLQQEAQVLRQLRGCPHVIQCFGEDVSASHHGGEDYNLLLEYAPASSLGSLIYPRRCWSNKIKESDVPFYTYQILMGLVHVHNKGLVHCDLKPENILVFPTTRDGKFLLKLADFGVSTRAGKKDKIYYDDEDDDDDYDDEPFCPHHCRGSLVYASPEYLSTGIHETSDDIWSLGCVVIEMFTGDPAWLCKDTNDLITKILDDKPAIPEDISDTAKDFVRRCFYKKKSGDDERWTARMLLTHPFVLNNKDVAFLLENDDDGVLSCPDNPFGYDGDQWVSTKDLFLPLQSS